MRSLWESFKEWFYSNIVVILILSFYFAPTIFGGLIFAGSTFIEEHNPFDYVRITDIDYKAVVNDEDNGGGKISVTEKITFDIHAMSRSNGFWELWRDLPESEVDGVRVTYDVKSVKQVLPDGRKVAWEESPELYWEDSDYVIENEKLGPGKWFHSPGPYNEYSRDYECLLFYVNNLYRETMTFEIEYDMYNAVLGYNDCADLYVSMYSGEDVKYLNSFNAQFLIPNEKMPQEGNYKYTTYGTTSGSFPVGESSTKNPGYHTFSMSLGKRNLKFDSNSEYIEFDLVSYGNDKHAFAENTSKNMYSDDDVLDVIWEEQEEYFRDFKKTQRMKQIGLLICVALSILVLFSGKIISQFLQKEYQFFDTENENTTFRDIPSDLDPKLASDLVFCKHKGPKDDSAIYSSILLSLVNKGYIDLKETSSNVLITLLKPDKLALEASTRYNHYDGTAWDAPAIDEPTLLPTEGFVQQPELDLKETAHEEITFDTRCSIQDQIFAQQSLKQFYSSKPNAKSDERTELSPYKINDSRDPLSPSERYYLEMIEHFASTNDSISLSNLQSKLSSNYSYTNTFLDKMKNITIMHGLSLGYIQTAKWRKPKETLDTAAVNILTMGIVILILGNLIISQTRLGLMNGGLFIFSAACIAAFFILKKQARKYVLLTKFGEEEYQKWRGLYNFLKSDTLIKERTVIELPLWEKYLIYATAFGISEKVIKAISIRCPQITNTQSTGSTHTSIIHNHYCRSGRIRTSGTRMHSSIKTGASRSHYSSYGGGGYGGSSFGGSHHYGGGGRGGGGGGGGH